MDLGSILVRIGADTSDLRKATQEFEKTSGSIGKMAAEASKATNTVERAASQTAQAARTAAQAASQAASQMQSLRVTVAGQAADLQIDPAGYVGKQLVALGLLEDKTTAAAASVQGAVSTAATAVAQQVTAATTIVDASLGSSAQTVKDWTDVWVESYDEMAASARNAATVTTRAADESVDAAGSVGRAAERAGQQAANAWTLSADSLKTMSSKLSQIGGAWNRAVTLPIAAVGTAAVAASLAWDDAMDEIIVRTGATGAELEGLQRSFREIGSVTPGNLMDAAIVISELNTRMGLAGDLAEDLTTQIMDMGRLSKASPTQMVTAFGQMARGWTLAVDDYAAANDRLWTISQKTGLSVLPLQQALGDLGPTLRSLGYDFERSSALIGRFYELGVDPSDLTTALRTATAQFRELGIDSQKGLQVYSKGIMEATSEQQRLALATQVFGERAAPLMADAIKRGVFQLDEFLLRLKTSPGAVARTSEATWGWTEQLGQFKNKFSELFAPIGDKALGLAAEKLPTIAGAVDKMVTNFSKLDPRKQDAWVSSLAMLAVAGPALTITAAALSVIGTLATPLGAVLAGITGIAFAVYRLNSIGGYREKPPTYEELDKLTQQQFDNLAADMLKAKKPGEAKEMAMLTGFKEQRLYDEQIFNKQGQLQIRDAKKLREALVRAFYPKPGEKPALDVESWMKDISGGIDAYAASLYGSGEAIPETIAAGIESAKKTVLDAMLDMTKDADKPNARSDAEIGPFSDLTGSGRAIPATIAAGVLDNVGALTAAMLAMYVEADAYNAHSDARRGPFSRLTQSGRSIPITIAKGVGQSADRLAVMGEHLASSVMLPVNSMERRLTYNTRNLRDNLGDLWWQTSDRLAAATRYGVDAALDNLGNIDSPRLQLTLDEDLLKFAPDEFKDAVEKAFKMNGPFELTLDTDLQPKIYDDKRIGAYIEKELAKRGPLEITTPAHLQIKWELGAVALTGIQEQAQQAVTASGPWELTLDANLEPKAGGASALDAFISAATGSLSILQQAGQQTSASLSASLDESVTSFDSAAQSMAGTGEQVKGVWAQLAAYTIAKWATASGGIEEVVNHLAEWLPPEIRANVVDQLKKAFQTVDQDSKKGMEAVATSIMDNLMKTHPTIAQSILKLEEFRKKVDSLPGPVGDFCRGAKTAFEELGKAMEQSFGRMAANALVNYFDQLTSGEAKLSDFRKVMKAFLLDFISMVEKQVLASKAAGIATAIANAPATFGASLAAIPGILAEAAAALAVFEGLKAVIRSIPEMAKGGIVTSPTVAMVGEGSEPEAIIPLSQLPRFIGAQGATLPPRAQAIVAGERPTVILNLTVSGNTVMNERDVDRLTDRVMTRATGHLRRLGLKPARA